MRTCGVLHCTNPLDPRVEATPLTADDQLLLAPVCDHHRRQIAAGAPWSWDVDPGSSTYGSILMGRDRDLEPPLITRYVGWEDHGLVALDGSAAVTLHFEKVNGDGSREGFRLFMSERLLRVMTGDLAEVWGGGEPAPPRAPGLSG